MKKRKKFDDGGSVMDKPSRDMRDPRYRKQLEREQGLETSAPEFMLAGPAGAARAALKKIGSRSAKSPDLRKNITFEIGENVGKPRQPIPKELRDALREIEEAGELSSKIMRGGTKSIAASALDINALDARRREPPEGYKKGGAVKSASSRADGIAQRGKTRGRMK
jgi:hypothetical protein